MIRLKRVYEAAAKSDGRRFLVERLWPRGLKKSSLKMEAWLRDVAPTTELRKWFGHDPSKWKEFQRRYKTELQKNRDALQLLLDAAREDDVTLLFSSHDVEHNNAVVLKEWLEEQVSLRKAA